MGYYYNLKFKIGYDVPKPAESGDCHFGVLIIQIGSETFERNKGFLIIYKHYKV